MADREDTELDKQVAAISRDFAERLDAMAAMPSLRAGLLGAALSDLVWTLYYEMPDLRYELADELEGFPAAIRHAMKEDEAKPPES